MVCYKDQSSTFRVFVHRNSLLLIRTSSNGNLVAMLIHVCSEIVLIEWPDLRTVRAISHSHNHGMLRTTIFNFSGCCTQELLLALCA